MNYYHHHLGDYDGATAHVSWDEDMAYTRLMRAYYRREKPIPLNMDEVFRLIRACSSAQRKATVLVLNEFFDLQEDGWHNKRCDEEIANAQEKSKKAHNSAAKRWQSKGNADAMRTHMPTQSEGNAPNIPITNTSSKEAAAPPSDLWTEGAQVLRASGVSVESARIFIGRALKQWPADTVLDALREAKGTADPKAYTVKLLQTKAKKPGAGADPTAGAR